MLFSLRQMKIFSDNAGGLLDQFSKEFETTYLSMLKMRHGTKRVNANNVYQEVIQDRHHLHMNATKWVTLTDFVQYLGKQGKCVVEETERGWYIQYIERNEAILQRQEMLERRLEAEKQAEVLHEQQLENQRKEAAIALDRVGGTLHLQASNVLDGRDGEEGGGDGKLLSSSIQLKNPASSETTSKKKKTKKKVKGSVFDDGGEDDSDSDGDDGPPAPPNLDLPKPPAPSSSSRQQQEQVPSSSRSSSQRGRDDNRDRRKRSRSPPQADDERRSKKSKDSRGENDDRRDKKEEKRNDYWLYKNILVRIINKKLANGKFFKCKAIVDRVLDDKYSAEVTVLSDDKDGDGVVIRLDQDDLETVVPKVTLEDGSDDDDRGRKKDEKKGKKSSKNKKNKEARVRILNPRKYRGYKGYVVSLDKKRYEATVEVEIDDDDDDRGPTTKILKGIPYEDISKLA